MEDSLTMVDRKNGDRESHNAKRRKPKTFTTCNGAYDDQKVPKLESHKYIVTTSDSTAGNFLVDSPGTPSLTGQDCKRKNSLGERVAEEVHSAIGSKQSSTSPCQSEKVALTASALRKSSKSLQAVDLETERNVEALHGDRLLPAPGISWTEFLLMDDGRDDGGDAQVESLLQFSKSPRALDLETERTVEAPHGDDLLPAPEISCRNLLSTADGGDAQVEPLPPSFSTPNVLEQLLEETLERDNIMLPFSVKLEIIGAVRLSGLVKKDP